MKWLMATPLVLAALAGCGPAPVAVSRDPARSQSGTVVIPPDSPMLKQIGRAPAASAELPNDEVVAPGKIEVNPNRVSKVALPVAGRITGVLVKTGDAVEKDAPLVTVQSPDADGAMSAFLSAQASLTQALAAATKAQSDFDRASDLFEHDAVAQKDVLAAESARLQAAAAVSQARAALEQTRRRLSVLGLAPGDVTQDVVVRSPLTGKVLELSVVPGEFKNDTSASIMTIADLQTVWVTAQVPESAIRFIRLGERIEINLVAYPGERFDGRVSRIADTVDPQTHSVKVQAEIDNGGGRLRPEMYGSIHHVESKVTSTVVPAAAIVQDGDRSVVFVERMPGHFEERDVAVGKRDGDRVRIVSGVKPGDSIVVDGAMLLKGLARRTSA